MTWSILTICNTMSPGAECSEILKKNTSSICSLYFSLNCVTKPTFFPNHWSRTICNYADSTGPVPSDTVQSSNERDESVICCCGVHHRDQLQELFGDGQSLVYTEILYGQFRNILNVRALINCNRKCNNLLDFVLQLPVKSSEISEILSVTSFRVRLILACLSLLKLYNFCNLQDAYFHELTFTVRLWC